MPKKLFNSETGRMAGKKSKRKPFDQQWREKLETMITKGENKGKTPHDLLFEVIMNKAMEGDLVAAKELYDRCYGKAKQSVETRDKTLEENPMYKQMQAITDKFKEK
jgi:CO dehydrogenase/acetyl-CoA synthase alpha subunit